MALIVVGVVTFLRHSQPENISPETCGNSSHEALSLGCSFDVISFAWLPDRCSDKELVDDFLALKHWNWYLDAGGMWFIVTQVEIPNQLVIYPRDDDVSKSRSPVETHLKVGLGTRVLTENFPRHTAFPQKLLSSWWIEGEELNKAVGDVPAFALANVLTKKRVMLCKKSFVY